MRVEKTAYFYQRLHELCLGIICFGLFTYYFMVMPVDYNYWHAQRIGIVQYGIAFVAADAFPFVVQIPFLLAYLKHGRSLQHNILNPMVDLVGATVYITAGGMSLWVAFSTTELAVGSMFTITGIVYFLDLCYWMKYLRKEPEQQPGELSRDEWAHQSPPPNIPMVHPYIADPNRYVPPMPQQYDANLNQQYVAGPPMTQQYIAGPPMTQQYIAGPPMTQQYIAGPNQQYNPPMVQQYTVDQSLPYGAPMGQQQN